MGQSLVRPALQLIMDGFRINKLTRTPFFEAINRSASGSTSARSASGNRQLRGAARPRSAAGGKCWKGLGLGFLAIAGGVKREPISKSVAGFHKNLKSKSVILNE